MTQVNILKVVVASSSDVQEERNCVKSVLDDVNDFFAAAHGMRLEAQMWEEDAFPGCHPGGPQGLVDQVLKIDECDIFVAIYWNRYGTPTPDARSGTEHEFGLAYENWKQNKTRQIMLYFNEQPSYLRTEEEIQQRDLVIRFRKQVEESGEFLTWPYQGAKEFKVLFRKHLIAYLRQRTDLRPVPPPPPARPDPPPRGKVTFLSVEIENADKMAIALGDKDFSARIRTPVVQRFQKAVADNAGYLVGDNSLAVFARAADALSCAVQLQHAVSAPRITIPDRTRRTWTAKTRVGVHTAETEIAADDRGEYYGEEVGMSQRMKYLAAGGQIIVSDATARAAGAPRGPWREWSDRRVRGYDRPETVWELLWSGTTRGEPGSAWAPEEYETGTDDYVPRPVLERKVVDVISDSPIVTLHAYGGMGKTRLAIACGIRLAGMFRDGVHFVRLVKCRENSRKVVADAIRQALGMSVEALRPETVATTVRDKDMLLILDNYESVAKHARDKPDDVAPYLRDMVSKTSPLRLLLTSREKVNVGRQISLDEGMADEECRELFVERARLKKEGWKPSQREERAIEQIVRWTERIPLAIELAAARVDKQSIPEIAESIEKGPLSDEDSGAVPVSERQASLRRSLKWSYDLLDQLEQDGFARLGVFPDSFTLGAASTVCNLDTATAQRVLGGLQDAALVRRNEDGGQTRYQMRRPARAYAKELLSGKPDLDASLRRRFITYFADRANEECAIFNRGPADPARIARALDWMETEWGNICGCAEFALEDNNWEAVSKFSEAVLYFLLKRGHLQEWESLLNHCGIRASRAPRTDAERHGRGMTLNTLGVVLQFQCRFEEAEQVLLECRDMRQDLDLAKTLNSLGMVFQSRGKWEKAYQAHQESLRRSRALESRAEEATTLANLGLVYENLDQSDKTLRTLEASWKIGGELRDPILQAEICNSFGRVYQGRGKWSTARKWFRRRLTQLRQTGDRVGEARTLNSLGSLYKSEGENAMAAWDRNRCYAKALEFHQLALDICRRLRDAGEEGVTLRNLAQLHASHGRLTEAIEALDSSWPLLQGVEQAKALNHLGWLYELEALKAEGDERHQAWKQSLDSYQKAERICDQVGDDDEGDRTVENLKRLTAPDWRRRAKGKRHDEAATTVTSGAGTPTPPAGRA